jgi:glycosyltransferase involved in cell wall biosynthesis
MSEPTIAAVIPLHNKENFVVRALASVLAQTRPVDEIIVVDDASTDGSLNKVKAFADPRLTLLSRAEPGPGGYAARNTAIRAARSQWIAFLDADDIWKDHFLAEIAGLIARAPPTVGCVFTGFEKVWSGNRLVRDPYSAQRRNGDNTLLNFERFVSKWIELGMSPVWTSACVIRRDVLLEAGLFPERLCRLGGDKDTWLRVMARTDALCSPRLGATYDTLTENQVTRRETFNHRPCLIASVERMLPDAAGRRRSLLKRLLNLEAFEQALKVDPRERLSTEVYRGYFVSLNPLRYVLLLGFTYLPTRLHAALRLAVLRGRSVARRLGGESRLITRASAEV